MNDKITIIKLARLLAQKNGKSEELCEEFIRALFREIAKGLQAGENVKLKGLGTFKLSMVEARKSIDVNSGEDNEIPAHYRITFIPAKELAKAVNVPFEMFETVILEESITEEALLQAEVEGNELAVESLRTQVIIEEEKRDAELEKLEEEYPELMKEDSKSASSGVISPVADMTTTRLPGGGESGQSGHDDLSDDEIDEGSVNGDKPSIDEDKPSLEEDETSDNEDEPGVRVNNEYEEDDIDIGSDIVAPRRRSKVWVWCMIASIVIAITTVGILWWFNYDLSTIGIPRRGIDEGGKAALVSQASTIFDDAEDDEDYSMYQDSTVVVPDEAGVSASVDRADSDDAVPTRPSDSPVYDTVTESRYLSIIAREHYGNFNLWPYIYKENEKILGHPNRIRPGTRVVVPSLSKYGIDPKNKSDIEKAKRLGVEIYKKYDN